MLIVLLLTLAGCATGPSEVESREEVPDWIVSPPEDTREKVYFVGAGSESGGDEGEAKVKASEALVSSIISFIGIEIESDTPVEAREALNEYRAELTRSIRRDAGVSTPGFTVKDTYIERRGTLVNVYLLGSYEKEELLSQKSRLRRLFNKKLSAVESLERRGDELRSEGQLYRAVARYIEAAASAVHEDIPDAEAAYERNIDSALAAIEAIRLERLNNNLVGYVRQSFSTSFRCKVSSGAEKENGLKEVPLAVRYRVVTGNGEREAEEASVITNDAGIAEFVRPAPRFVGSDTVTFMLDIEEILQPLTSLENLPEGFSRKSEELRAAASRQRLSFSYTVTSRATEIPTAVWVMGFDNGGNPLPQSEITTGIIEVLRNENFNVSTVSLNSELLEGSDAEIMSKFTDERGNRFERLIFGSAYISDFNDEGGRYSVQVSGDVKAADLPSGIILYDSGTVSKSANGQNLQSAISAAFKEFGKHVGKELSRQLP